MLSKVDFHVHSNYSDGKDPLDDIVATAENRDINAVGISDHYRDLPPSKFHRYIKEIDRLDKESEINILKGIEVDIEENGVVSEIPRENLEYLDYVIGSVHLIRMGGKNLRKFKILESAIRTEFVDIIGHPMIDLEPGRNDDLLDLANVFNTSFEVNCRYRVPSDRFLRACLDRDVDISIGSDSHNVDMVGSISWALNKLDKLGATKEDIYFPGE